MNQSEYNIDDLFGDGFVELPWPIVEQICDILPPEIITGVFLKVEKLRSFIIEKYFSRKISLFLPKPPCSRGVTRVPEEPASNDIIGFDDIAKFLSENPDIVPQKYTINSDYESSATVFAQFGDLLRMFHTTLSQAPELVIDFEIPNFIAPKKGFLSQAEVDLILSFPNLSSLRAWFLPRDSSFAAQKGLKKLTFQDTDDRGWSNVSPPPSLTELVIDIRDIWTMPRKRYSIPYSDLYPILWESSPEYGRLSRCSALTSLTLCNCGLESLDLSLFPPTLENIDLDSNKINRIEYTGSIVHWPENIKSLSLKNSEIGNQMLQQLSDIGWPPLLEELDLESNTFTTLDNLKGLPLSLKYLNLCFCSKLRTLMVSHNHNDYPYFIFPESLRTLNLHGCCKVFWDDFEEYQDIPLSQKMRFPPNLKTLYIGNCNLNSLEYVLFPSTLETLVANANGLPDLTSYDVWVDGSEIVSWRQLENLRKLDVSCNILYTLDDWIPPKSLRELDLSMNDFRDLNGENAPLFDEKFQEYTDNIRTLMLCECEIEELDDDLWLPRNLSILDLSSNDISWFEFNDSFASHKALVDLNLSGNKITGISVECPQKKYQSNLKKLNLTCSKQDDVKMTSDKFYEVFEQLGLQVVERSETLSKVHMFH